MFEEVDVFSVFGHYVVYTYVKISHDAPKICTVALCVS